EAFRNDSELLSVSIPSTVTAIGTAGYTHAGAFQNCAKLQTVTIAKGTKDAYIDMYTFSGCVALTTVHIPSNYTSIRAGAFSGCGNVTICNTTSDCYAKTYADTNNIPFRICSGHAASVSYTVTLNANGGSVSPASFTVNSGDSITLPTPTRSGYTCLGWSTSSTATSASYACGASYRPTASVTLYAVWQKNSTTTYTVTLNANGGSVSPSSFTVNSGDSITLPTPTRSGYTCLGWSTSSSASSASYACGASYRPTASVTLYAVWQDNSPVVVGSLYVSTDSVTVKENEEKTVDFTKTGSNNAVLVSCDDPDVFSFVQNEWNGDTSSVTIHGLKAGTARLTLTLFDQSSGTILDTKEVSVTVKEPEKSSGSTFIDVLLFIFNGTVNFFMFFVNVFVWLFDLIF
ncbi:MAG: InlB B-repeat-containing protein, partial [Oscillospiraceae bacterium]|nr:InlB B-repeat-containing protein [Oscillospiraceae bacterium]